MAQIFISYKRKDKDKVFPLVKSIENELGCKCWVDLDGIESSMQFASVICRAIDNAEVVLFMHSAVHLSIDYENDWTVKELNYAHQKSKRVVLVRLDGAPLDNIFLMNYGSKNNIDSRDPLQFEKLLNDLRSWLQLPQHKSTLQPEVMCPCGSGKLFKDCHGRFISLDNSTESHHAGPVETERSWKVGDYYTGANKSGIVFWVDHTGKHGKIVSLDQKNNLPFCKYSRHDVSLHEACDGEKNFQAIKKNSTWKNKFPASEWCARHGDGWYLPAIEELCDLVRVYDEVNQGLKENKGTELIIAKSYPCRWYLSSTEYDETRMRAVGMEYRSKDFLDSNLATREIYIRAIAKF